jgi:hypothetical protein
MNANIGLDFLATRDHKDHKEILSECFVFFCGQSPCCGKTLLAIVASRKRCGSASWRNPTANTAMGRVLRSQHSFSSAFLYPRQSAVSAEKTLIRVYWRSFAVKSLN